MAAAARTVAVEILDRHATALQVLPGRAARIKTARRTDVVGGDRIAEYGQRPGVSYFLNAAIEGLSLAQRVGRPLARLRERVGVREFIEKWRSRNVSGIIPLVLIAGGCGDRVPQRQVAGEIGIQGAIQRRVGGELTDRLQFRTGRPDVF